MLRRVLQSPELRWHAPFVIAALIAWLLGARLVAVTLVVGVVVSFTLMRVGRRHSRRVASLVAERYPTAAAHFLMDLLPAGADAGSAPGRRPRGVVLVITADGLAVLDAGDGSVVRSWPWQQVEGVAGYDTAVGSTPAETVVLALADEAEPTVELRTFAVKARVSDHVVLLRPDHLPWPSGPGA